jgi:NADPH:quinone reductase-like Zn-dependent oxidoreductase
MKTYRLNGSSLDQLLCREEDVPPPAAGEVQVDMKAAALNYRDVGVIAGVYPAVPNLVPLSDGAGAVVAVGEGVTRFAVGDHVVSCFYEDWQGGAATPANHHRSFGSERDGMLGERVNLPATGLVHMPASLTHVEAATLTCAGLTAWTALFSEADLAPGQHVVVQGTGGVSIFALQFAKMAGAKVSVLSSSDAKLERARALGADHLLNYRTTPNWSDGVVDFTNGLGADVIIEVGGPDTFAQSQAALRMDGTIAIVGLLSGIETPLSIPLTITRRARIHGVTVGHREDMLAMVRAIDAHGIKPVVDKRYAFADARQAYEDLPKGNHFGKLVIEVDEGL